MTKTDVAEELNVSGSQVNALLRRGDLRHIKVGGRGVQRIERCELEAFIQRAYVGDRAKDRGAPVHRVR